MSGSKLNPNVWQGEERDGGFVKLNPAPKSGGSPTHIGRLWIPGYGWVWLSGWLKRGHDQFVSLRARDMSDADALKWCAPKRGNGAAKQPFHPPPATGQLDLGEDEPPDPDIPF